jgi:hypothetical protein
MIVQGMELGVFMGIGQSLLNSLLTENKDFWKLLRRNFVVSFRYLLDFLFWFFVVISGENNSIILFNLTKK